MIIENNIEYMKLTRSANILFQRIHFLVKNYSRLREIDPSKNFIYLYLHFFQFLGFIIRK